MDSNFFNIASITLTTLSPFVCLAISLSQLKKNKYNELEEKLCLKLLQNSDCLLLFPYKHDEMKEERKILLSDLKNIYNDYCIVISSFHRIPKRIIEERDDLERLCECLDRQVEKQFDPYRFSDLYDNYLHIIDIAKVNKDNRFGLSKQIYKYVFRVQFISDLLIEKFGKDDEEFVKSIIIIYEWATDYIKQHNDVGIMTPLVDDFFDKVFGDKSQNDEE